MKGISLKQVLVVTLGVAVFHIARNKVTAIRRITG